MKQKIINSLCVLVIVVSVIWIAIVYFSQPKSIDSANFTKEEVMFIENKPSIPNTNLNIIKNIVDFGVVKEGEILTAHFLIENTGEHLLVIENVNPDCTCTSFSLSKYKIEQGDTCMLTLNLDTKNKKGPEVIRATIRANTKQQDYFVILKAEIDK